MASILLIEDDQRIRQSLATRLAERGHDVEATAKAMVARHPMLEAITVSGQGHAPLLRDTPTLERIAAFVQRCDTG